MRILASNPDTIGDMVLRQPLYRALLAAGHELTLVVRASVAETAGMIAPGARTLLLPREVYGGVDEHWPDFAALVDDARRLAPDVLLVAPYQWTRFEERLAGALRAGGDGAAGAVHAGLVVAGMSGRLFAGDPFQGPPPPSTLRMDRVAAVDEDLAEAEKNAALADLLGCPVAAADPGLEPDANAMGEARRALADRGLEPGGYWVACVTGTRHVPIKAWPAERWAELLRAWHERHDGRRFLFVGTPDERPVVDQVLAGMGEAAAAGSAVWMEPGGSVRTLAALAALSGGYVGHDTGPMHVAAAVGKPVLAVFGGGHKLRFLPRVTPSVALAVRVPCAGCGWACSFEEAHCVKALTVEQVLTAADDLEAGRVTVREARLADPSAGLLEHMAGFAADLARQRLREAAGLATAAEAARAEAGRFATDLAAAGAQADDLRRQLAAVAAEAAGLVRQVAEREHAVAELRRAVAEADGRTAAEADARRREVAELRRAADDAGRRAAAEADARRHEVESLRQSTDQAHRLAAAEADARQAEVGELRLQLDLARQEVEALRRQVEALTPKPAAPPAAPAVPPPPAPPAEPAVPPRPRKTWRELAVDLVCGTRTYAPWRAPRPMPKILVVTRVQSIQNSEHEAAARATIESVLAERYPHLEYVLVAETGDDAVARAGEAKVSVDALETVSATAAPAPSPPYPGERDGVRGRTSRDASPPASGTFGEVTASGWTAGRPATVTSSDVRPLTPTLSPEYGGEGAGAGTATMSTVRAGATTISSLVAEYRDRVTRVVPPQATPFGAVADAFAATDADLVAWLDVGQVYEPGALMRIGEYFRDHPLAFAAAFGQTVDAGGGWRFPKPRLRLDVESLRLDDRQDAPPVTGEAHVVYRRSQYALLGPLNPDKGYAAGWDLLIRFARRFGIRHGRGQSVCLRSSAIVSLSATRDPMEGVREQEDWIAAAKAFEASFGAAGRLRCGVLHLLAEGRAAAGMRLAWRRRLWLWPPFLRSDGTAPAKATPEDTPVSPLSHRRPDRLLFAGPDVTTGDPTVFRAYYDAAGDVAMTFPPVDGPTLQRLHAERAKVACSAVLPLAGWSSPQSRHPDLLVPESPFCNYRGGPAWVRRLADLPSPYWRLARVRPGGESDGTRLVSLAKSAARPADAAVRCLVVGCYDGTILDELKALTRWQLTGLETNADAVAAAKAKGHTVWPCSPQDAFMCLPDGEVFDLILLPAMLEHWDDPAWVLRRLTRLLTPAGAIVVRTPNLDSRLVDLFGPTWWHWQLPYHRTLLGRRGLRNLARLCSLRVAKLRTVTDAYAAAASVQLNAVGLAGVVPEGAAFDPAVSAKGAKLAGWARLLWDRWGKGDETWAVLRPM